MIDSVLTAGAVDYFPLVVTDGWGNLILRLHEDGTPEFGVGVTQDTAWLKIAEALPRRQSETAKEVAA